MAPAKARGRASGILPLERFRVASWVTVVSSSSSRCFRGPSCLFHCCPKAWAASQVLQSQIPKTVLIMEVAHPELCGLGS